MGSNYFVYIITNPNRTVLYTGMTNDLESRLIEHYLNRGRDRTFAGRYFCFNLIYYERHSSPTAAIEREKEIKDWNRSKKEALINTVNPEWKFLNGELMEWPPAKGVGPRR
jgi:putative endonuclease